MIDITVDYIELKKLIKRLNDNDPTLSHLRYCAQYSLDGAGDWQKMLVDAIGSNNYITHVDLSGNIEFSDSGALRIGALLSKNHTITRLEIRSCGIGSKGIKAITSGLKSNNTLKTLDLSGNNVGDSILFIIDYIKENRSLKSLKLRSCNILPDSTKEIAKGLRENHTLQLLDLSQNSIGRIGLKNLFKYLNYEKSGIIYLGLEYIDFNSDNDVGIDEFCKFIEKSKKITHISLRGNIISSEDTYKITESLKKGKTLKKLNLGKTSMDEKKCKILGEYIGSPHCQIFSLSLSCNNLSQYGLRHIMDGLKKNLSLTTLDLSNNGLTESDGLELLSTLKDIQIRRAKQGNDEYVNMQSSKPITKLNVSNNKKLGSKFIEQLSSLLKNGELALEELNIANLGFSYKSGGILIEAIKESTTLNTIDLIGNEITNEHMKQLASHFKSSTSLALVFSDLNDKKKKFCKKDFRGLNLDKIPRTTFFISNLTELNLRNNNLTRIPPQISFLILLKKLDVSGNKLKTLPPELGKCVNLRKLKLLPGNDFKSPPQEIIECASDKPWKVLEYLRLFLDFDSIPTDWEEISIVKNVGKGSFGMVYEAYWDHQRVAVKQISVEGKDEEKIYHEFRKEVSIMSELKNPFLVNLLGFCIEPTFAIIMDFAEYGDLYSYIHSDKSISWDAILKIAHDIAQGLNYLHSKEPPFIHRDLKSPNVFLASLDPKSEVMAKVGDFGLSSKMFSPSLKEKTKNRAVVNPTWLAPEILKEEEITLKSDIYSFGIILWELITRSHPFEEYNIRFLYELEDSIIKSNLRPKIPENCPTLFKELIEDCWHNDPSKRPLASEIIERLNKMKDYDKSPDLNSSSSDDSIKRRRKSKRKSRRRTHESKQDKS